MTISMYYIVMNYGNAMQSEDSNVQGKLVKNSSMYKDTKKNCGVDLPA